MSSMQHDFDVLREQLQAGSIQKAYRALLAYVTTLRSHLKAKYPVASVSGLYQGYLDMSYFALAPPPLERHGLKIAIVFNYKAFRFEAWLAATNRQLQRKYWELFKTTQWSGYRVVAPAPGVDSIVECILAEDFDAADLDGLTTAIEKKAAGFIRDMEAFLGRRTTPPSTRPKSPSGRPTGGARGRKRGPTTR